MRSVLSPLLCRQLPQGWVGRGVGDRQLALLWEAAVRQWPEARRWGKGRGAQLSGGAALELVTSALWDPAGHFCAWARPSAVLLVGQDPLRLQGRGRSPPTPELLATEGRLRRGLLCFSPAHQCLS